MVLILLQGLKQQYCFSLIGQVLRIPKKSLIFGINHIICNNLAIIPIDNFNQQLSFAYLEIARCSDTPVRGTAHYYQDYGQDDSCEVCRPEYPAYPEIICEKVFINRIGSVHRHES